MPYQRRGFAHPFDDYAVSVVAAEIDTRNAASVPLVESPGFVGVSLQKDADFFEGTPSDEYRYEVRRPEHRRC